MSKIAQAEDRAKARFLGFVEATPIFGIAKEHRRPEFSPFDGAKIIQ